MRHAKTVSPKKRSVSEQPWRRFSKNKEIIMSDPQPMPPGTDVVFGITCRDVLMGRGSRSKNHCGNVTYRKLVDLNKVGVRIICVHDSILS